jgi:hypothetical protein
MTIVCGIDPGLASGGLVLVERQGSREEVLRSVSLVEKRGAAKRALTQTRERSALLGGWGDNQFTAAATRSAAWMNLFRETLKEIAAADQSIDFFAIESFVDQPSRARQEKAGLLRNRWQTPLTMGRLAEELERRGYSPEKGNLFYQNAGTVLRQWKTELGLLEKRKRGEDTLLPGDSLVSNDHERKALVHALALLLRLEEKGNLAKWKEVYWKEDSQ